MTAKEKAQNIYDKVYEGMGNGVPKQYVIKCATIVVDEMIDYLTEWGNEDISAIHAIYLYQVKNELIKI
jgi:hypothetical protein